MRTNCDPPSDPFRNEPGSPEPSGEWYCPECGHIRRTYRGENDDNAHCVKDGKRMIWKPDEHPADSIWCGLCEIWVERKDFIKWTGDDALHYLCPGCDSDMLPVQNME